MVFVKSKINNTRVSLDTGLTYTLQVLIKINQNGNFMEIKFTFYSMFIDAVGQKIM